MVECSTNCLKKHVQQQQGNINFYRQIEEDELRVLLYVQENCRKNLKKMIRKLEEFSKVCAC